MALTVATRVDASSLWFFPASADLEWGELNAGSETSPSTGPGQPIDTGRDE